MKKYQTEFKLEVVSSFLAGDGGAKLLARQKRHYNSTSGMCSPVLRVEPAGMLLERFHTASAEFCLRSAPGPGPGDLY